MMERFLSKTPLVGRWFGQGARSARTANSLRFDSRAVKGHVESYFLRANHPSLPKAIWLKATILSRPKGATADAWCIVFDGERGRTWAHRETVWMGQTRFEDGASGGLFASIAGCDFDFGSPGGAKGQMQGPDGHCSWDLAWVAPESPLARELCIYPYEAMVEGPFPRSKLLTPYPYLRFSGRVECFGEAMDLDGWHGMQGHNWGREHAWEYAWGQCLFPGATGKPHCMVEGFTGRIRVAGVVSPRMSAMVIRRGDRAYRFDGIFDFWRQRSEIGQTSWTLHLSGRDGEALLVMVADPSLMVCLGYQNPDRRISYCLNSKLARVHLRVNPRNDDAFQCQSEDGGALEFLRNDPDPRFHRVV